MNLPMCELFEEREAAACAYLLFIMAYHYDKDQSQITWGEALMRAISSTPKFQRDWVNLN